MIATKAAALGARDQRVQPSSIGEVTFTFESFILSVSAKLLNIGRGGMFIHMTGELPSPKQLLSLSVSFNDGQFTPLKGVCRSCWVREKHTEELPRGVGLEFFEIDELTCQYISRLLEQTKAISHIPMK